MRTLLYVFSFGLIGLPLQGQNPDLAVLPDTSSTQAITARSSWTVATVFNSRVLVAGRDYGQSQFGIFPSLSYQHRSGVYASLGGSVFGDTALSYTQSLLGLGYGGQFSPAWRYTVGFSHTFFHPDEEGLLANSLSIASDLNWGAFNFGASFCAMLGEERGYRLNLFGSTYWPLGRVGLLRRSAIAPAISGLFGTENIPFHQLPLTQFERATGVRWLDRKRNIPVPPNPRSAPEEGKTVFGLMSVNLALPLYYYLENWSIGLNPTVIFPVLLSGETYTNSTAPSAYFSFTLARTF